MEWDDDGLDDEPVSPLLPQEDRLWRHPSEVAAPAAAAAGERRSFVAAQEPPRLLSMVALTSTVSILLTLATVAVVRPIRDRVAVEHVARPAASPAGTLTGLTDVATLAERLSAAVPMVEANGPSGRKRGSGVVYRTDGLVLTNHHLVHGAGTVRVYLGDGRSLEARVVGTDEETDIAVLDIEGDGFAIAPLGSAGTLKVGHPAITIGTPDSGVGGPVVTVGVVAAKGQAVSGGGLQLLDMIQTDASVPPGCSGGAVVDSGGVVIGIATWVDDSLGGYATPIDVARVVAAQLLNSGKVTRGWLGVEGDDLPSDRAKAMGLAGGAVVKLVKDKSPAVAAGLAPADVIAKVDDKPVRTMTDLVVTLRMRQPGDTVSLRVMRGGEERVVKVTLAERP